jgi:arginyl-tRNA synthetase
VHFHVCCGHDEGLTLGFVRATQRVVARSLDLIGVEAPERM